MKFAQNSPVLGAILYNVLFGLAYLPLKVLTTRLNGDAALLITLRFGICFLALRGLKLGGFVHFKPYRATWLTALPICTAQLLNGFLEATGMRFYPSGKSSVIMALVPLISALLAVPVFREIPSLGQTAFILLSFWGVTIVSRGDDRQEATMLGFVLILSAAVMSSLLNLCIRKLGDSLTPLDITYAMSCTMLAVYGPLSLLRHAAAGDFAGLTAPLADPVVTGCLLYLAVGSSLYAAALRNIVFAHMPVAAAASFTGISTITAVLAGVLLLKEPFGPRECAGTFLVLLGVIGVNLLRHRSSQSLHVTHHPHFLTLKHRNCK